MFLKPGVNPWGPNGPQLDLQDQEIKSTWGIPVGIQKYVYPFF